MKKAGGSFRSFFRRSGAGKEEAPDEIKQYDSLQDFDQAHFKRLMAKEDKFIDLLDDVYRKKDVQSIPAEFEKAMSYLDGIKQFCYASGQGGIDFYKDYFLETEQEALAEHEKYMETEYESRLAAYLEELSTKQEEKGKPSV